MKAAPIFAMALFCGLITGCSSSLSIATVNGKMSCSFKNQKAEKVAETFTKSFGPMKGLKVEMPAELKEKQLTFDMSGVTTAEEVRTKLEEVTEYKVEIDEGKKVLRFTKKG